MEFNLNENREVVALLGAGSMGTAIIKRISTNRIILLGDINEDNLKAREEELKFKSKNVDLNQVKKEFKKNSTYPLYFKLGLSNLCIRQV